MTDQCLGLSDIVAAQRAPLDDPRQLHLQACPRCRALLYAYYEFMDPATPDVPAGFEAADRELSARLRGDAPESAMARAKRGAGGGRSMLHWLRLRPLYGVAVALLACAVVVAVRDLALVQASRLPRGTGALRGDVAAADVAWSRDGAASELTWRLPANATGAVVILYDGSLQELARVPVGRTDRWRADAYGLEPAYAQVLFLADADTLSRSGIVAPR